MITPVRNPFLSSRDKPLTLNHLIYMHYRHGNTIVVVLVLCHFTTLPLTTNRASISFLCVVAEETHQSTRHRSSATPIYGRGLLFLFFMFCFTKT